MRVELDGGGVIDLGVTEMTPTIGITDYSRRVTDDFGVTSVVERGFSRRMSVRFAVPTTSVDTVQQRLAGLRATAASWVADDAIASLAIRGFYKEFSLDLAVPPLSFCTLTVEGLTETASFIDPGGDAAPAGQVSTLRLIQPFDVAAGLLSASSVAETDAPAWSASTTYTAGARVMCATTHRVYESTAGDNLGHDPAAGTGEWIDLGPTNRWAMFDQALGTATTAASSIVLTLSAGAATALALLDVDAATVRVQVQSTAYDRTVAVGPGTIGFLDLPGAGGAITVTIAGPGLVAVGTLLVGRLVALGVTEASPTAAITDYSRKEVDDFGDSTIVERAWAKRMTTRALIRTDAVDTVAGRIAAVRARPCLWIGDAELDSLTVYGFFKDFSIEVGTAVSTLSLSIEGLSKAAPLIDPDLALDLIRDAVETAQAAADGAAAAAGEAHQDALKAIVGLASQEAIQRQAARARAKMEEMLLRLLSEADRTRRVFREAGVVVDEAAGTVRIHGVDEALDRTSRVEIGLDAAKAAITLRATVSYVQEQIALAVIDPSQVAELGEIVTRINDAEVAIDGLLASVALKASSTTVSTLSGEVSDLSLALNALSGEISLKASSTRVDAIDDRLGNAELLLQALPDVSTFAVSLRQTRRAAEGAAHATLSAILSADEADRRLTTAAAEVQEQLYTRIIDGDAAEAGQRVALTARTAAAEAAIKVEQRARSDGDAAEAIARTLLAATLRGETDDAVQAAVELVEQAIVEGDQAAASSVAQVVADLGDESARVSQLIEAVATPSGASATAVLQLTAGGKVTGFKNTTDGSTSSFAIEADRFIVGDAQIFEVDTAAGVVRMRAVEVETIRSSTVQKTWVFHTGADIVVPVGS